jgi:hypothetical protein
MLIAGWDTPLALAKAESARRIYERCAAPHSITEALDRFETEAQCSHQGLEAVLSALAALAPSKAFTYGQPDELEAIRKARPPGPRQLELALSDAQLLDRYHGAWTERAAGCALGKPVK